MVLGKASSRSSLTGSLSLSDDGLSAAAVAVALAASSTAAAGDKDYDVARDDEADRDKCDMVGIDYDYEFHSSNTCMACMKITQCDACTENRQRDADSGK